MEEFVFRDVHFTYELYSPQSRPLFLPMVVYLKADDQDTGAAFFTGAENQNEHPSFVLVPEARDWTDPAYTQALQRLIFDIRLKHDMDICRTYLAGQGKGAVYAWHLLSSYPRVFAGTLAVGGCGDPYRVRSAKFAPVWAFHSTKDEAISVNTPSTVLGKRYLAGSRRLIDALRTDGSELARYTETDTDPQSLAAQVFGDSQVRSWLYEQDRKKVLWVYLVRPGVYRIDDWFMSSCYLIEGNERALMIDTAMAHTDLMKTVRKLTALPVSLAVTHPHMDHMMHAYAFDSIYLQERDAAQMDENMAEMKQSLFMAFDKTKRKTGLHISTSLVPPFMDQMTDVHGVIGLKNGDRIDLGGVQVEMLDLGGHTKNHVVFVDHGHRCVFTGDAVGSGYVVGVNYPAGEFTQTYAWYRSNLVRFLEHMAPLGEYTYFGGHFIQENSCTDPMQEDYLNGQSEYYVPLSIEVVKDMKILCDELLDGKHDSEIDPETGAFFVTHGSASLAARRL